MPENDDLHMKLPPFYKRLLAALCRKTGMNKTTVVKLALFELAVKHGIATEFGKE